MNPGPMVPNVNVNVSANTNERNANQESGEVENDREQVAAENSPNWGGKNNDLAVVSLNVRGLNDSKKVRHLINQLYKKLTATGDKIIMLQETYVRELKLLDYIWRGDNYVTPDLVMGIVLAASCY